MKSAVLVCVLFAAGSLASPTGKDLAVETNEIGLELRESQLMTIYEGARQLGLLLTEIWHRGSAAARSLSSSTSPSEIARALQESDPIELALNTIDLNTEPCRQRVVCEIQDRMGAYSVGNLVYGLIKSRVPELRKYGYLAPRDLGVDSCSQVFQCRLAESSLMESARQVRSLAADVCDMEGDSISSSICRAVTFLVDKLETL